MLSSLKNKINSLINFNYKKLVFFLTSITAILLLYYTSSVNYLLFHSLVELFGIIIASVIFTIALNLRNRISNSYIVFLGYAYLFIAVFGILHTISYKGINIFAGYPGANLATQMWIASRYMESITLLIAPFFIGRKLSHYLVFTFYTLISTLILLSIFYWNIFPLCFDDYTGLTSFKKISEYIISIVLILSIFNLLRKKEHFDKKILILILCAITFKILTELSFTEYSSVYDLINVMGHIFAVISYVFIYLALISSVLIKPFDLMFRDFQNKNIEYINEIQFIRAVVDAADILVTVTNKEGYLVLFNKSCEQLTGYSLPQLQDRPYWEILIKDNELEKVKNNFENLRSGTFPDQNKNHWKMKDGSLRFISWSKTALLDKNNNVEYIVAVGRDITDITNLQRENKNIISMIAHDMKSPLLSVQLFANQLIKKWNKLDESRINDYLNIISKEGEKLNTLIDEFLDFSLVRNGLISMDFKSVDLRKLIDELYNIYLVKAKQQNIKITKECSFDNEIICDASRLNRVLTNLLDNAIKFSKEDAYINIKAYKDKDSIKIEIEDNGIGIPREELHSIFHPFIRGKKASDKDGYGVGLAYVKTVIEKHNGSVSVKSKPGKGTTFTIKLPVDENNNSIINKEA
jgi:PAS domain S-box-containing protein